MKKVLLIGFGVCIGWLIINLNASSSSKSDTIQATTIPNQVSALTSSTTHVYVGYGDGRLEVWQLSPPKKLFGFIAHDGAIRKMLYDEALDQLITVGARGSVARWDRDWRLVKRYRFTDRHLNDAIISSSKSLVVGGDKGHLSQVGARPWRIQGIHNLAVFGLALDPIREQLLSVGTTNTLNIWAIDTGENLGSIPLDSTWGQTIKIINDEAWVGDERGRVQVIQLSNNTPTKSLKVCNSRIISSATYDAVIAFGCENGQVGVIDTTQRRIIITHRLLQTPVFALTFFNNGLLLGSTGPTMRFLEEYDKAANKEINVGGINSWGNSVQN
ncbi:MAG: WD40 repeat domain-containing protein [Bradymonadia bacterium]